MIITIIGGSGFVGTRLVKRLLSAGHSVRIADKRCSVSYPELWQRCDIRNSPEEKNDFPESLTDAASAPGKYKQGSRTYIQLRIKYFLYSIRFSFYNNIFPFLVLRLRIESLFWGNGVYMQDISRSVQAI